MNHQRLVISCRMLHVANPRLDNPVEFGPRPQNWPEMTLIWRNSDYLWKLYFRVTCRHFEVICDLTRTSLHWCREKDSPVTL